MSSYKKVLVGEQSRRVTKSHNIVFLSDHSYSNRGGLSHYNNGTRLTLELRALSSGISDCSYCYISYSFPSALEGFEIVYYINKKPSRTLLNFLDVSHEETFLRLLQNQENIYTRLFAVLFIIIKL